MKYTFNTELDKQLISERLFYRVETYNKNKKLAHINIYSSSFTFDYIYKDITTKYPNKTYNIEIIIN